MEWQGSRERAACGVGFVASTTQEADRDVVDQALLGLCRVEHRGGRLADRKTGDGAGLMTEIPFALLGVEPGSCAVATWFSMLPPSSEGGAFEVLNQALAARGLSVAHRRAVPVNTGVLGRQARELLPRIHQLFIEKPKFCRTESSFGTLLHLARQAARTALSRSGFEDALVPVSVSTRTIVYKALTQSQDLADFYPDLQSPDYVSRFALFHRRFSTNTRTSWDKVQPFRMVAHNGEINTIEANRAWSYSREQALGLPKNELMTRSGISDSGYLNEMVEALRYRSSIPHLSEILAIMIPPASAQSNAFYKFWSRAVEPWDGPAFVAFSDGELVGARLDRNGFRPGRWLQTRSRFYLASEAGLFDVEEADILRKGALHGGRGVHVKLATGEVHFRDPSESRENYNASFDPRLEKLGQAEPTPDRDVLDGLALFGVSKEEIDEVLVPMALDGKEPIGSMGDTARLAVMSDQPRSFFDFFFQNFAQVTNPPLDHLRERLVTDLSCHLGRRPNVFEPKTLIPLTPGLELSSPVLTPRQMAALREAPVTSAHERSFETVEVDMTFPRVKGPKGLAYALEQLSEKVLAAIRGGCSILILSDRRAKYERPPIPSLLALQSASRVLTDHGHRLDASLVVEAADVRSTHHLAALVGFGAGAVAPHLAFAVAERMEHRRLKDTDRNETVARIRTAFDAGLLKIMSKMGISTVQGYKNSKLFTAVGLGRKLLEDLFPGLSAAVGGFELEDVAQRILEVSERERTLGPQVLIDAYLLREQRKGEKGEAHSMTAELSKRVHAFCADRSDGFEAWSEYEAYLATCEARGPTTLRDLWKLREDRPIPVEDVQPGLEITRRFGSGAMSFGAISAESQRDLIKGMAAIGGRSASGEGGENPFYEIDGTTATVKQVASGRFGVTAEYLMMGEEIEIKVAQGAKPGEGGQLMGLKVDAAIAKARHASEGVDLISPPPLHDIYSIEDLRQLIYELKQLKPGVQVTVKLVSGAHVGTIATGVVKAGADVVQVSGGDGGTGAASLSSMRHAGLPWEIGLASAHQALLAEGLRSHCILRVDGGLRHGQDIVKAACLGAEEFGFGKLILIAEGCIMARVCQKNTCPRGIATHDPKFKKKYRGSPDDVATLMRYLAEDVRRSLARMGFVHLEDVVGRGELLERGEAMPQVDLGALARPAPHRGFMGPALDERASRANARLLEDLGPAIRGEAEVEVETKIRSTDRATLATAAGAMALTLAQHRRGGPAPRSARVRFRGSAGQGFCAFLTAGLEVELWGEANDSVAKSMSGGRLVIRPPANAPYAAAENTILGNGCLYGATGGELFADGLAGDRFAVRNSGATAVIEGVGLHACEYMTGGTVVILGGVSYNVGAGMTGGELFLRAECLPLVNTEYIVARDLSTEDQARLVHLVRRHAELTGSASAARLLENEDWTSFRRFIPRALSVRPPALARV
ncbi:MAG: glutamate synthase large subunit [Myxococcota bacterium]